ncbi:MAG: hypothetical protein R3F34_17400 [Planctomycetota bacterium]
MNDVAAAAPPGTTRERRSFDGVAWSAFLLWALALPAFYLGSVWTTLPGAGFGFLMVVSLHVAVWGFVGINCLGLSIAMSEAGWRFALVYVAGALVAVGALVLTLDAPSRTRLDVALRCTAWRYAERLDAPFGTTFAIPGDSNLQCEGYLARRTEGSSDEDPVLLVEGREVRALGSRRFGADDDDETARSRYFVHPVGDGWWYVFG